LIFFDRVKERVLKTGFSGIYVFFYFTLKKISTRRTTWSFHWYFVAINIWDCWILDWLYN